MYARHRRYHLPLDPECPEVERFHDRLYGDPMTAAMGAPTEEIEESFASKHRLLCERCREFGAANVGYE